MNQRGLVTLLYCCALVLTGTFCVTPVRADSGTSPSAARQTPLVRAVIAVKKSVVNIHSEKTTIERSTLFPSGKPRKVNGMGTGIIIDERGYLVTNHHVIADVDLLRCVLDDGSTYTGRVVAKDAKHDLAIVKIDPSRPLKTAPYGTSSDLMLGETVIAIGNAYGYEHSVTSGILSHLSRDVEVNETQSYENLLQTDASINPGNSGGPLLNLDGEVIGINVAIRAGAQRIGFAIPMDDARRHIAAMFSAAKLEGVSVGVNTTDYKQGSKRELVVSGVIANSAAEAAGLRTGDIIKEVESLPIMDRVDLERSLLGTEPGAGLDFVIDRDGEEVAITLTPSSTRRTAMATVAARPTSSGVNSRKDKAWQVLGTQLSPLSMSSAMPDGTQIRGGMLVTGIRPGSPAEKHGIKAGDVLVGLHEWETVNHENITFVLDHPKLQTFSPLKFYIMRGEKTLYGHLQIASRPR